MDDLIGLYIDSAAKEERKILQDLRSAINSVSRFEETIAYNMPAFRYKGKIVACFRFHKNHIGFYPYSGSILSQFSKELEGYKVSTGALQLSKDKLPKMLLKKIIKARMAEIDSPSRARL
jgi:uncharacterized protein YdhG (YjbR/CyaY superfamily)